MEAFKLVNFKNEYNTNMPIVRSIEGSECEAVCRSLFRSWHVNTLEEFFEKEEQELVLLDDINAEDEDFDWNKVFNSIGIPVPNEVSSTLNASTALMFSYSKTSVNTSAIYGIPLLTT